MTHSFGRLKYTCIPNFARCRYLSSHLGHYYFRFLKTIVICYVRILLPILIFTFVSPSACHSASAYQISSKSEKPWQSYDVISSIQDGGLSVVILLPVSFLVTLLICIGRHLQADQISTRNLNPRLRYYYFQFQFLKARPPKLDFYFRFRFLHLRHHQHVILIRYTKFHPNWTIHDIIRTSYTLSKMAASVSQLYFQFQFSLLSFVKVKIYLHTKFPRDISIRGWDITISGFWIQMSAMFEFYFRFQLLPLCQYLHVVLHLPTKFLPNWTIRDRVLTSYPFLKMAATASRIYFRFRFSWLRSFEKVKIYLHTKCRRDICIRGRHLEKCIWRHNYVASSPIWTKLDRQMQNDMPMVT